MQTRQDRPGQFPGSPIRQSRGLFAAVLIFSVFTNLLMLTGPLFMLQVYDRVLSSRAEETLAALLILVAALFLFFGLLDFARGRVMARIGARFQARTGPRVLLALLERASLRRTAEGGTAMADLEAMRNLYTSPVLLGLCDLPWTPVFLAAIFIFHPMLGWLAAAGGAVLIIVAASNQWVTRGKVGLAQTQFQHAGSLAREAENGGELIWAQGMGPAMIDRWVRVQDRALTRSVAAHDWTGSFASFSQAFRFFLQSAILALGAWLVLRGQLTAGAMIAASILMGRMLAPVERVLGQWPVVECARRGWRSLKAFLAEVPEPAVPTELPRPEARLSLRYISVMVRRADRPVLANVSLEIAPGEALGVIGKSGAGKSTLARVILGLVQPQAGEVRLAGATLDQYGAVRLGQAIGYLPQEIQLFDATIAENIAQMDRDPPADRVVAAARKARMHDVILRLPDGYDTRVGSGEVRLSGGQKQRLALARARALYNDPVLLVLDEPNSALDADGSTALNAAVAACKAAGGAVVVMTHRPRGDRQLRPAHGAGGRPGCGIRAARRSAAVDGPQRRGYQADPLGRGKPMSVPRKIWRAWPPLGVGFVTIAVMAATVTIWGLRTQIAGAVVAGGTVRVESYRQVIQHPEGGVVGEILARDGDTVSAGQVLVRLDGTFLRSELSVVERQLFEIHARKARLEAEQAGHASVVFAPWIENGYLDATWRQGQIDGQRALFEARRDALDKEVDQLRAQQVQIEAEIDGITSQLEAQHTQLALVGQDLEARASLLARGLIQAAQVLDLRREKARLKGDVGRLNSEIAEARTRTSGLEIEIVKLGERRREAAITRLRDLQYSEIELAERRIRLAESLARLDVRAPVDGVVFGSRIFAVQSVVRPADAMMYLVPGGQPLEISARIEAIDIDQVHPGQEVLLRFTSFDQRTTPEVLGRVARLSADAVTDEATGETYYEAVILPDIEALAKLDQDLMPGMPVEAFLRTADRTPLQFLIQPLANYFKRAFREG